MKVYYNSIKENINSEDNIARGVGLGNFDGVHIGHRTLISTLVNECEKRKYTSMVYTFGNHPNNVLFQQDTLIIMNNKQKQKVMASLGLDELYFAEFDIEYAHMTPKMFVEKLL